jgi:hypothetical protein
MKQARRSQGEKTSRGESNPEDGIAVRRLGVLRAGAAAKGPIGHPIGSHGRRSDEKALTPRLDALKGKETPGEAPAAL